MTAFRPLQLALLALATVVVVFLGATFLNNRAVGDPMSGSVWLDPTSARPEAEVYRAWRAYFESKGRDLQRGAGIPSSHWVADEQQKWPMYDLAGFYVPAGAVEEVTSIKPLPGREDADYEIEVDFFNPPSDDARPETRPVVTGTWRVRREAGQWLVANVLPGRTRSWHTETVGQITYYVEPALKFDRERALLALTFVDSLADAFDVPRLERLDYYVTSTVDAALNATGVAYPTHYGPGGGFAKPVNHQLFAAVPMWGENYRHELTHLVLRPLLDGRTMTILASEGIATWYGGSSGMELPSTVGRLRDYFVEHPATTLDSVLVSGGAPQTETYAAGAVLSEMLFQAGGVTYLKRFLGAGPGPEQLRAALIEMLDKTWEAINAEWRQTVERMAGRGGQG